MNETPAMALQINLATILKSVENGDTTMTKEVIQQAFTELARQQGEYTTLRSKLENDMKVLTLQVAKNLGDLQARVEALELPPTSPPDNEEE